LIRCNSLATLHNPTVFDVIFRLTNPDTLPRTLKTDAPGYDHPIRDIDNCNIDFQKFSPTKILIKKCSGLD